MDNMTWREVCFAAKEMLKNSDVDFPEDEVFNIFKYCFNMNKTQFILNKDKFASPTIMSELFEIIKKRKSHIPLQYILGEWEFMGLKFKVGEGVLIPREDTGVLVNESLNFLSKKESPKVVDLCSGSGCIAITLEKMLYNYPEIYAIEFSKKACNYLIQNIENHNSKVNYMESDIFQAYSFFEDDFFDMIVSNPPYIKSSDISLLQSEVRFEPEEALNGGNDGLDFYHKICKYWIPKLKSNGMLAFEIGMGQFKEVENIMKGEGLKSISFAKDINNINRVITGIK